MYPIYHKKDTFTQKNKVSKLSEKTPCQIFMIDYRDIMSSINYKVLLNNKTHKRKETEINYLAELRLSWWHANHLTLCLEREIKKKKPNQETTRC